MRATLNIEAAADLRSCSEATEAVLCRHCGTPCTGGRATHDQIPFCCRGCQTVYELLVENGLGQFYELGPLAATPVSASAPADAFAFLDTPAVRERVVDFTDGQQTRVTFRLPAIHCVACVWLLENLFRLEPGIGRSTVNFERREATVTFEDARVRLSRVAALLASIGYEPDLKLVDLDGRRGTVSRRLWLQVGVAGFAFGNTMLFSLPAYFGLDTASGPAFRALVGWLSLGLSIPVVAFSASDYWRTSWTSLRQRQLTLDVPIALGIAALFLQSAYDVFSGRGEGFFDSLAGLLFFLLCGKIFQQKTFERLAFDRDYRSFFPLSICRRPRNAADSSSEERVALASIEVGDRLVVRHGELIPADARLAAGDAIVDYSFVTGESEPVRKTTGEWLYAGGRQVGGLIEVETLKPVSQSHLTSLWNQDAFRKVRDDSFQTITNQYSRRFTWVILGIATAAALFWSVQNPANAVKAFAGVLIVACPCALALAAPFTLGAAVRSLGRRGVFLRNAEVLETLARVDTVVFDKTGTLTGAQGGQIRFEGSPLESAEAWAIRAVAAQSAHPLSKRIVRWLDLGFPNERTPDRAMVGPASPSGPTDRYTDVLHPSDLGSRTVSVRRARRDAPHLLENRMEVGPFRETPGAGIDGMVGGHRVALGSAAFVGAGTEGVETAGGSVVHVAIDDRRRGRFVLSSAVRPETDHLLKALATRCELALLSGDNARDQEQFQGLFGPRATLHFNQSPLNKLGFIRALQQKGKTVMMVGDGLNDAGALRQSQVGVAVVENIGAFSPASDVILDAALVPRMAEVLAFSRRAVRVVRAGFLISTLYNIVGISIAASANLSPVVCAILMPLSSVTVIAFASGVTTWLGNRAALTAPTSTSEKLP